MALCTPAAAPCIPAAVAPCRPAERPPALFDAVLYPNRSLGRFGFHLLMAAIVLVSAAIGAAFVLAGAWPVTGFLGADVLLLYLAFRWNYRQGRRAEFIRLDGADLVRAAGRAERPSARVALRRPLGARHHRRLLAISSVSARTGAA